MKTDITSKKDIHLIITLFYNKLINDQEMLPFFKDIIAQKELEHHINIITNFWQDILLYTHNYKNNPMQKHLNFHKKMPFKKEHFTIWLHYLTSTIDSNFTGKNANNMKSRANSIAMVMQLKMNIYNT